ncbi:MAG: helix-turn-helix domain-containing protein [Acidobacteria bacterium]|nr:helix-turn-helix domain-containing protein [Acidobacteriota bacterium]
MKAKKDSLIPQSSALLQADIDRLFGQRLTITEDELCQALGISRVYSWMLRRKGKLKFSRQGKNVKFTKAHVLDYLNVCESDAQREVA